MKGKGEGKAPTLKFVFLKSFVHVEKGNTFRPYVLFLYQDFENTVTSNSKPKNYLGDMLKIKEQHRPLAFTWL